MQFPLPSQACPFEQLPGTSVPAFAATHVPSLPVTLHDLQGPVHAALSQQTPSTQWPLAHDDANAAEQPVPFPIPVTLYSQSSFTSLTPFMELPPNKTITPRALSKDMVLA
jgi:hypothetical protein